MIATLFYATWHPILIQNVHLNPESLCLAGSTLMLFVLVKYLERPKRLAGVLLGLFPFVLIMLKPTYLILILVVFLFMALRYLVRPTEKKYCTGD